MHDRDYSRRIRKLRAALGLTQHSFADRLRVRPQVVASWEQGRREPAASSYQQLARLAPPDDAWFFLEKIGVTKELVRAKWKEPPQRPAAKQRSPESAKVYVLSMDDSLRSQVRIPLLRDHGAVDFRKLREGNIDSFLSVPSTLIPNPTGNYVAVRIRENSMAPILRDRSIAVLDRSNRNPARLLGRMVGVRKHDSLVVRWLAPESRSGHWILRAENPRYPVIVLETAGADFLIGAMVSWWGTQG
jgi:transcriptional regulator with XRE-family HTH domain